MGSTEKFDNRKMLIVQRLLGAWEKEPEIELGHLLSEAMHSDQTAIDFEQRLRRMTDVELVEAVERFVLLGKVGTP